MPSDHSRKEIRVCLRLDDYGASTPMGVVHALASILERHQAICLFGVIPFHQRIMDTGERVLEPLSGAMADLLQELVERNLAIPALHGFAHSRNADGLEEFASGSVAEQAEKIAPGKALLERIARRPVRGFVPPWNVVSAETEAALCQLGFSYVSTAVELEHTSRWSLIDVPGTCYWSARSGVLSGLQHLDEGPLVVLTGHFYDFYEPSGELKHAVLNEFDRTLAWLSGLKNVRIVGMDEASAICARNRAAWRGITRSRGAFGMPYQIRRNIKWPAWLPTTRVSAGLRRIQALGFTFWAALVLVFFLAGWAIGLDVSHLAGWPRVALSLLGAVIGGFAIKHSFARQATRAALLATAGCILGVACRGLAS